MVRVVSAFIAGAVVALGAVALSLPHCPTEDSCSPDYRHVGPFKVWTGKEQIP